MDRRYKIRIDRRRDEWDEWIAEENQFDPERLPKHESIFTQGNGYLGQRAVLEEDYVGQTRNLFVSGTYDRFHESEASELPNLPDVVNLQIIAGRTRFSMLYGMTEHYRRVLNLRTGELVREVLWQGPDCGQLQLRWRRTVSLCDRHIIAASMELTAERDLHIRLISGIDGRVTNSGTQHTVEGSARVLDGEILEYPVRTLQSDIQVALYATHRLSIDGRHIRLTPQVDSDRRWLAIEYELDLRAGQTLRLEKIAGVYTARDLRYACQSLETANAQLLRDSREEFRQYARHGYDELFARSAQAWEAFWNEQDLRIESINDFDQRTVRFAIYHMNCMINRLDSRIGLAAKGLSGEGYKGHSFWDTEIFLFPYFLFTQPEAARVLLEYRYLGLDGARRRAAEMGCRGAMYPWEAAWIEDGDVTPDNLGVDLVTGKILPCLTGQMELHVTGDVAYAVQQYYLVTGDADFMERCGYEILLETARFWIDRLEWNGELARYELRHIIGPDEYQVDVDNNTYTNYFVGMNLQFAWDALKDLEKKPEVRQRLAKQIPLDGLREEIEDRLQSLYLPQPDPNTGILPQFDGYFDLEPLDLTPYKTAPRVGEIFKEYNFDMLRRHQVGKQADVVQLLYLCEDLFPDWLRWRNYEYYEHRTLHDSSLSKAVHSVLASDLGMMEEAYQMYLGAAMTDFGPAPDSCDNGIHAANMGGIWQAVVMGFGGLRMKNGVLRIAPHLPEQWKRLEYRLHWRGRELYVTVDHRNVHVFNSGPSMTAQIDGQEVELAENGATMIPLERKKGGEENLSGAV